MLRAESTMIRRCTDDDFDAICEIINDGARAYEGVIPADRWHEPYMSADELREEIASGVEFWGFESDGVLIGVMGLQRKRDVLLIRHAYVRSNRRNQGVGSRLLEALGNSVEGPMLIGTWAAATWAISFYEKHGFRRVGTVEKERLLRTYWTIPDRQIETSVVLARG